MQPLLIKAFSNPGIFVVILAVTAIFNLCRKRNKQVSYIGKTYQYSVYHGVPQAFSGKHQCEYYDFGGEGVAFHDNDSINSGSGSLNPADGSYLNEFRIKDAVDI